ncbi:hypothetical protein CsSME_00018598 [Camellia sinensis var. sinensis]
MGKNVSDAKTFLEKRMVCAFHMAELIFAKIRFELKPFWLRAKMVFPFNVCNCGVLPSGAMQLK